MVRAKPLSDWARRREARKERWKRVEGREKEEEAGGWRGRKEEREDGCKGKERGGEKKENEEEEEIGR